MNRSHVRRVYLLWLAGILGAVCLGLFPAQGQPQKPPPKVRLNVTEFVKDEKRMTSLRAGIQAMQDLEPTHPFSWTFQANIHWRPEFPTFLIALANAPDAGPDLRLFRDDLQFIPQHDVFNQCPHRNWWFLPWHRAYIYHFERILRWAAKDPELTLPYWNYTRPDERSLPAAFRQPLLADKKRNPLFLPDALEVNDPQGKQWVLPLRNTALNQGITQLGDGATALDALGLLQFTLPGGTSTDTFAGAPADKLTDRSEFGALETLPHNVIHDAVGGDTVQVAGVPYSGFMAAVPTAARDPIFWLHHANIDRLWEIWLKMGKGRANPGDKDNPLDRKWLDMAFKFYDVSADGKPVPVTFTVAELLNKDLGYVYDDTTPPALPEAPAVLVARGDNGKVTYEPLTRSALGAGRISLSNKKTTAVGVALAVPDEPKRFLAPAQAAGPGKERLILAVEGIQVEKRKPADLYYEIHINPPEGAALTAKSPSFAGRLTLFDLTHAHGDKKRGHEELPAVRFNVTPTVRKLLKGEKFDPAKLNVVFVPRSATEAARAGVRLEAVPEQAAVTIGQVRFLLAK